MNVSIDANEDTAVRSALIINLAVEALAACATAVIFYQQLSGKDVSEEIAKVLRRWRDRIFGPPPPTEEEIQRLARLVNVEANRILREGE